MRSTFHEARPGVFPITSNVSKWLIFQKNACGGLESLYLQVILILLGLDRFFFLMKNLLNPEASSV